MGAYFKEKSDTTYVYEFMAKMFDAPCNYTFDDIDVDGFMIDKAPGWCDKHDCKSAAEC